MSVNTSEKEIKILWNRKPSAWYKTTTKSIKYKDKANDSCSYR